MEDAEESMSNEAIEYEVVAIYNHIQSQREKQKASQLEKCLKRGRDEALARMTSNGEVTSSNAPATAMVVPFQATSSSWEQQGGGLTYTSNQNGNRSRVCVRSIDLKPVSEKVPMSFVYAPVRQLLHVPDEKTKYLPHLADGKDLAQYLTKEDIECREKLFKYGPAFRIDEKNEIVDACLRDCAKTITYWGDGSEGSVLWKNTSMTELIVRILADKCEVDEAFVQDRLKKLRGIRDVSDTQMADGDQYEDDNDSDSTNTEYDEFDERYLKAQDSYRECFCQRCFSYCCNLHGPTIEKPTLSVQLERAQRQERVGTWKSHGREAVSLLDNQFEHVLALSTFHRMICKRMFIMFDGNLDEMSNAMRAPKHLLVSYIREQGFELPKRSKTVTNAAKKKSGVPYYSVKNYKRKWYKGIEEAKIHPWFAPCTHRGECSEKNCRCVMNHLFCTNACTWGSLSPNFFRGCGCTGSCKPHCTCALANRECDPDLCSCGPCCDPPGRPAVRQQCRNDNIRMRRNQHLLIGPSTVKGAGWGLFARNDVKKGDFLLEYVGELITQTEGERRGAIDDARNRTYLFNLCSDYAIDASRRGNKARFINHSDAPNCETKMLFVNGEQRIGFFAKDNIEAQSELFFDYKLNEALESHLISKSGKTFDWMKPTLQKNLGTKPPKRQKKTS